MWWEREEERENKLCAYIKLCQFNQHNMYVRAVHWIPIHTKRLANLENYCCEVASSYWHILMASLFSNFKKKKILELVRFNYWNQIKIHLQSLGEEFLTKKMLSMRNNEILFILIELLSTIDDGKYGPR